MVGVVFLFSQFSPNEIIVFNKNLLSGQTVHRLGAHFCVCFFLDSKDKYLNMFQNVSGFHLQDLCGFRVHIVVT